MAGRPALLREILRFLRTAGDADVDGKSFDRFLRDEGYSESFRWHYLVPMTAALWSTAPGDALEFPAAYGIDVLPQSLDARPPPATAGAPSAGGSRTYVRALLDRLGAPVQLAAPVRSLAPHGDRGRAPCRRRRARARSTASSSRRARRAPSRCSRIPRRTSARSCRPSRRPRTRPCCTPTRACSRDGARIARRGTTSRPAAACYAERPSLTYSLNRLQRLETGDGVLRHAQPHGRDRRGRGDSRDRLRASADDVREPRGRRAGARLRRRAAHRLRRRVAGQRLPRGRARLRAAGRGRVRGDAGEERALHRHGHARAPRRRTTTSSATRSTWRCSTSTSCRRSIGACGSSAGTAAR